ncbi:ABC transporter, ATP-binding domain-containing protein [Besnoitia besnoiti]|uniref:ABC transporter, ATP-binding domain-containing protein n=1 Tax=Besnoitia besnoiti TaxID=94643 RepID=A0A2A9MA28_BESBE|nr:ABC transporter, ATP-binding domain-containing protein [Besnoitia besnoiti]PFH32467.1 ABC transporter, ATP-binding domain-containing protein [Besnoitia besnoiti]
MPRLTTLPTQDSSHCNGEAGAARPAGSASAGRSELHRESSSPPTNGAATDDALTASPIAREPAPSPDSSVPMPSQPQASAPLPQNASEMSGNTSAAAVRVDRPVIQCKRLRYSYHNPARHRPLSQTALQPVPEHLPPPTGSSLSTEFLDSMASAASAVDSGRTGTPTAGEAIDAEGERDAQREWQLFDVSLEIPEGARVVVIGSNGAGKSTLLNILGGKMLIPEGMAFVLERPAFHDVTLGRDVACLSEWWKGDFSLDVPLYDLVGPVVEAHIGEQLEKKGNACSAPHSASAPAAGEPPAAAAPPGSWVWLFHGEGLFAPLPCCAAAPAQAGASLRTDCANYVAGPGADAAAGEEETECIVSRVRRLVTLLGVDMRWRIARISDGERRRCQLLAALCEPRKVYILDEATSDLDLVSREGLLRLLLHESTHRGATVLYSTHIFDGLDTWATHLLYIQKGRVKLYKPLSEISAIGELRASGHSAPLYALVRRWLFGEWQHHPQLAALERKLRGSRAARPPARATATQLWRANLQA